MDPVGGITSIDNLKAAGNENARMTSYPVLAIMVSPLVFPPRLMTSSDLVVVDSVLGQCKGGE